MSAKKRVAKRRVVTRTVTTRQPTTFYRSSLAAESADSFFAIEHSVVLKTIEAVNNFNNLYRAGRRGARGGPSTHAQQDLYRAMLIFACAGLDMLVKQLLTSKLALLVDMDEGAQNKFKEYVKGGINRGEKEILNTVALALIDRKPRDIFLKDYIESMTKDSLQSGQQLCRASDASGLNTKQIFTTDKLNSLKDTFAVRNEIIHEMDINLVGTGQRTIRYRSRRTRTEAIMEGHTTTILDLAQELFTAYKSKFEDLKIGAEKKSV